MVQALDGNVPGTVANYSCNADYALFGNVSRECVSTGQEVVWTGEAPTCRKSMQIVVCIHTTLAMATNCMIFCECTFHLVCTVYTSCQHPLTALVCELGLHV